MIFKESCGSEPGSYIIKFRSVPPSGSITLPELSHRSCFHSKHPTLSQTQPILVKVGKVKSFTTAKGSLHGQIHVPLMIRVTLLTIVWLPSHVPNHDATPSLV